MRKFSAIFRKGVPMARTRKGTPPAYPKRPHVSGQARITVRFTNGKRHDLTLGTFGSPESRAEYQRVLAELEAHGGRYPVNDDGTAAAGLTLNELALLFWRHAKDYYRLADGSPSRELEHYKYALKPLLALYGHTPANAFGPKALKAVRQQLIDGTWLTPEERAGRETRGRPTRLCRKVINQRVEHIKRVFAWAVGEQLIPPTVHDALLRLPGLRRGHEGTYDRPKVKPVADAVVRATLPYLVP
jgi:hypothetical protein